QNADVGIIRAQCMKRRRDVAGEFAGGVVLRVGPIVLVLAGKRDQDGVYGWHAHAINRDKLAGIERIVLFGAMSVAAAKGRGADSNDAAWLPLQQRRGDAEGDHLHVVTGKCVTSA